MSHDAIENMPYAPHTPTISSVGSELSFEDVTSGSPIGGGPKEHPELFHSDHMVTIQVEETLFRIPAYFLTQDSAHFAALLENKDAGFMVYVTDVDVSSTAFANLLVVLRPRLGVTPISTLSEWTDVLQLSTKWGFEHLRTAAITAILPLASAMDKLVLGRTYGFVDWVSDAYTDLLKREDDLTLDEAKKMALEDVVAIAKGRREARTQRIKPDAAIEEIVQSILPVMNLERKALEDPNSHVDMVAPGPSTVAGPIPQQSYASSVPANDRAKIVRWVSQMQSPPPSRSAPGDCLVKFMQEDRIRVPVVLDTVLERGLKSFRAAKGVKVDSSSRYYSRKTYLNTWSQCADGGRFLDLLNMSSQDPLLQLSTSHQAEAAALRLVDRWQLLAQIDFNIPTEEWIASEPWSSLRCATTYLAYLVDGPESTPDYSSSVVGSSVFLTFWTTLAALHRSTSPRYRLSLAEYTKSILSQVKEYVSKVEVSVEIDAFYLLLEEARDAAQPHINDQDHELVGVLNSIIADRYWPRG